MKPYLNQAQVTIKAMLVVNTLLTLTLVFQAILVVGVSGEIFKDQIFPIVTMIEYAQVGEFITSLEAPFITMWLTTIVIKISLLTWVFTDVLAKWLNLQAKATLATPFGLISIAWSLATFPNSVEFFKISSDIFPLFAISIQFFLPILLFPLLLRNKIEN